MSLRPHHRRFPEPLRRRLAAGGWLRTAHRGAPTTAPGNTLPALAAAVELGVDLIEIDLQATADGQLILWHDTTLQVAGRTVPIARTALAELRQLAGAEQIALATFAEALDLIGERAGVVLDLKAGRLAPGIAATIKEVGWSGSLLACGHYWQSLRQLKALVPGTAIAYTLHRSWRRAMGTMAIERGQVEAVTINWRIVDRWVVRRYHAAGLAVLAWTVDDPAVMARLLALGVDGLTSNRPELFSQVEER